MEIEIGIEMVSAAVALKRKGIPKKKKFLTWEGCEQKRKSITGKRKRIEGKIKKYPQK